MGVELLTEYHLEFLSLKRGCTDSSKSTLVKMPHCWKSHVPAQLLFSCASREESDQHIHQLSLISLRFPDEKGFGPYFPAERKEQTLIRLRACPG